MTLIEIMVVLVIISLVTGVVGVNVMNRLEDAKKRTALTQIKQLEEALELYKLSKHHYPNSAEGLNALTVSTPQDQAFLKEVPVDPWDKAYVYISPGTHNQGGVDIMSYGPDGVEGGGDDIANWK
jgi:general secretion pathway protein G